MGTPQSLEHHHRSQTSEIYTFFGDRRHDLGNELHPFVSGGGIASSYSVNLMVSKNVFFFQQKVISDFDMFSKNKPKGLSGFDGFTSLTKGEILL